MKNNNQKPLGRGWLKRGLESGKAETSKYPKDFVERMMSLFPINPDKSYITARSRVRIGPIYRYLDENDLLVGKVLDFGCGKGFEADYYGFSKFDPHYFPVMPPGKFDTIVCNYVFCVVPKQEESGLLHALIEKLNPGGSAFISVRRDISKNHKGLTRYTELNLPIIKETGSFCIYEEWK